MNGLEFLRLSSAASVILLGVTAVVFVFSTFPFPPYEIEEVSLISLDPYFSSKIEDLILSPQSTSGRQGPDPLNAVIESEVNESGMNLEEFWGDNEEDWIFYQQGDFTERQHRRLSQDEFPAEATMPENDRELGMAYTALPSLLVAVAGLVTLCAMALWFVDSRKRPRKDKNARIDASPQKAQGTSLSTKSTFAKHSHVCSIDPEPNQVLSSSGCAHREHNRLFHGERLLSPVSSMTASFQDEEKTSFVAGESGCDVEAASNPSLFPFFVNQIAPIKVSSITLGLLSPDRSSISSLSAQSDAIEADSSDSTEASLSDYDSCYTSPRVNSDCCDAGESNQTNAGDEEVPTNNFPGKEDLLGGESPQLRECLQDDVSRHSGQSMATDEKSGPESLQVTGRSSQDTGSYGDV